MRAPTSDHRSEHRGSCNEHRGSLLAASWLRRRARCGGGREHIAANAAVSQLGPRTDSEPGQVARPALRGIYGSAAR